MKLSQVLPTALLTLTPVLALPPVLSPRSLSLLSKRQSCVETCASTCYWQSDIDAALQRGYSLYQSGETEGSGKYPHEYYDDEGFDLAGSAPYYEFPILNSYAVYSGGSPGADRVVFDGDGDFAALITHTGASGNNFVQCAADS